MLPYMLKKFPGFFFLSVTSPVNGSMIIYPPSNLGNLGNAKKHKVSFTKTIFVFSIQKKANYQAQL